MSTELSIIGYLLSAASFRKHRESLYAIIQVIRSEDRFTEPEAREAFAAIHSLASSGKAPTVNAVSQSCSISADRLKEITLSSAIKIHDEAEIAAASLVSQSMQRSAVDALTHHISDLKRQGASAEGLAEISQALLEIVDDHQTGRRTGGSIAELLPDYLRQVEHEVANPAEILSLRFGIPSIDRAISRRIRGGSLVAIGAHTGAGKSVLATQLLLANGTAEKGLSPALLSFEMPERELLDRAIAAHGTIDYGKITTREMDEADMRRFREVAQDLRECGAGSWLESMRKPDVSDVISRMRMLSAAHNKRLFMLDYFQLVEGFKGHGRERELSGIGAQIKQTAIDLDAVIVLFLQLNDELFGRREQYRRPHIHDARESRGIIKDADVSFVIDRPAMDGRHDEYFWDNAPAHIYHGATGDRAEIVRFDFGKSRRGHAGLEQRKSWYELRFEGVYQRFAEVPDWQSEGQTTSPIAAFAEDPF